MTLDAVKRWYMLRTLRRCNGNRTRASRVLGISCRTLQRHLKEWGISRPAPGTGRATLSDVRYFRTDHNDRASGVGAGGGEGFDTDGTDAETIDGICAPSV